MSTKYKQLRKYCRYKKFIKNEVKDITDHRGKPPKRSFFVIWFDGHTQLLSEISLQTCAFIVNRYCEQKKIEKTILKITPCGATSTKNDDKRNHVYPYQVVQAVQTYGNPSSIQAEVFSYRVGLMPKDALYVMEVGSHLYAVLYIHKEALAIVADGLNYYEDDALAQHVFEQDF